MSSESWQLFDPLTIFSTDITGVAFLSKWITNVPVHIYLAKEYSLNFADSFVSFQQESLLIKIMNIFFWLWYMPNLCCQLSPFSLFLLIFGFFLLWSIGPFLPLPISAYILVQIILQLENNSGTLLYIDSAYISSIKNIFLWHIRSLGLGSRSLFTSMLALFSLKPHTYKILRSGTPLCVQNFNPKNEGL